MKDREPMIRRLLLPLFLSMMALGPLPAAAGAETLPAASLPDGSGDEQSPAAPAAPAKSSEQAAPAKSNDGRIAVTRSDGSTGRTRPPDQKEIRKLVGYMRDGMARADRAEKQRAPKRVIQYRPTRSRR
jgi:hypothetical protein